MSTLREDYQQSAACAASGEVSKPMSATPQLDDGDSVSIPSHDLTVRDGGDRVRLEWWHRKGVRARALFRVATDDGVAVLVGLDCWAVSQRPVAVPDWCESLDHIPDGLLLAMRGAGFTAAEGAGSVQ